MKNKVINMRAMRRKQFADWLLGKDNVAISLPATKKHGMDFPLFIAVLVLCAFGLVMLFSASYYYAQSFQGDGYFYVKSQSTYLGVGLIVLLIASHFPYTIYAKKWSPFILYGILILGLLLVLTIGRSAQGAQRWIPIGPVSVQPSELTRFIVVICFANYMVKRRKDILSFTKGLLPLLIIAAIPCLLILLQPNLSMVIIVLINVGIMLYVGGCSVVQLGCLLLTGFVTMGIYLVLRGGYQLSRVLTTFQSWKDILATSGKETYQLVQSLYAFANGGWFGQGFDASRQKLLFLPYRESDYILPIIAEELGFVAIIIVLLLYFFIIHRGLQIARNCKERFGSLLAVGMTCTLAVQVIINVAVVTGMLPSTGQTLPFISSGGTSLVSFLGSVGILLNVSRYTEKKKG